MTKFSKKITLVLVAVLCLVLCVGVLVACDPEKPAPTPTHTVTVLLPDETAAVGIDVTIKKGAAKLGTVATNSEGKALFVLEDDDYTVELSKLPEHFALAEDADLSISSEEHALTVTLVEDFHYTVTFWNSDENDAPFHAEGMTVQICTVTEGAGTGNCFAPNVFANGVAKFYDAGPGNYHVSFDGLPEDYELTNPSDFDEEGFHKQVLTPEYNSVGIYVQHVKQITTNTVEVTETLTTFAEQEGTLVGVALDGTAQLVYNETDKFYHLGAADGPVVVVNLTGENVKTRFSAEGAFVYLETVTKNQMFKYNVTPEDGEPYVEIYNDYSTLLKGFSFDEYQIEYIKGDMLLIAPENITVENYYANFVNSDGVYPLTKELETVLKLFCENQTNFVSRYVSKQAAEDCKWLFPCYYYDTNVVEEPAADAILGDYKWVSYDDGNEKLTVGDEYDGDVLTDTYKMFVINENGTFTVSEPAMGSYQPVVTGSWTNNGNGTYAFTDCLLFGGPCTAVVTFNSETGALELNFTDDMGPVSYVFQKVKKVDPIVGTYKLVSFSEFGDEFAVGDNYYGLDITDEYFKLTVEDEAYKIERFVEGNYEEVESGTLSVNNGVYTFVFDNFGDPMEYSVSFDESTGALSMTSELFSYAFQKA